MTTVNIIDANSQHFKEILDIMNYEILNKTSLYDYNERTINDLENIYESKKQKNFPFIVAIENEKVIGYAYYDLYNPKQGYLHTVEHSIYLKNGNEGKGVGKLLMNQLIAKAKMQNIKTMIALIDNENAESILFHEKYNFVTVGVMKQVGFKFNRWLDCRIMQIIL
jgi:L-amino acid N-acyltransferase